LFFQGSTIFVTLYICLFKASSSSSSSSSSSLIVSWKPEEDEASVDECGDVRDLQSVGWWIVLKTS
jgi:hypothetical protein